MSSFLSEAFIKIKFCVVVGCLLMGTAHMKAQSEDPYTLLWEVTHKDSEHKSYLFGSIHIRDQKVFNFPDQLVPALKKADVFALEVHPDSIFADGFEFIEKRNLKPDILQLLDTKQIDQLNEKLVAIGGKPLDSLKSFNFDMVEALYLKRLEKPSDKKTFMDAYLYAIASSYKKPIFGLESVQDQWKYYDDDYAIEDSLILKKDLIEFIETSEQEYLQNYHDLTTLYQSGNSHKIFVSNLLLSDDIESLNERNYVMVKTMENLMGAQTVFAVVGAAHLGGPEGIVNILQSKGYKVTPVEVSFNDTESYDDLSSFGNWLTDRDSVRGYEVKVPTLASESQVNSNFVIKTSFDMSSGGIMMFGVVENPQQEDPAKAFVENMSKQNPDAIKSLNIEEMEGHRVVRAILFVDKNPYRIEAHELNNNLYVLGYSHSENLLNSDAADYFFSSVEFFPPVIPENAKVLYEDLKGGFSTYFPKTYKDISQETANPYDEGGDPFFIYAKNAFHKPSETNYLLRYNDFPSGYYLEDEKAAIEGYIETLLERGFIVNDRSVKTRNGVTYNELLVTFQENFEGKMEIYFRGNRMYLLFALKDTQKGGPLPAEDPFFNQFQYQPLLEEIFVTVKDSVHQINFRIPEGYKVNPIEDAADSEIEKSRLYFGRNDATGGAYVLNTARFKKYATLKSLESYCDSIIALSYKDANDTIVSKKIHQIHKVPFHTYSLKNERTNIEKIISVGIAHEYIVVLQAYVGKEETNFKHYNLFFNGVEFPDAPKFDVFASKTAQLLKDLKNKDEIIFTQAKEALNYYLFDENDADKMLDALNHTYLDEDEENSIKEYLISGLHSLPLTRKQFERFKAYFLDAKTHDTYKVAFLAYYSWKDGHGDSFFPLLKTLPLKAPELYLDEVLSTLELDQLDRPEIVSELYSLLPRPDLRKAILTRFSQKTFADSTFTQRLRPHYDELIFYFSEDLQVYKELLKPEDKFDDRYFLLFQYLNLFENFTKEEMLSFQLQLNRIFELNDTSNWLRVRLLLLYLQKGIPLPDRILNEQLLDKYSRFEVMEALIEAGQTDRIPPQYFQEEDFTELSAYYYTLEALGIPDRLEIAGRFHHNDKDYLAYKATLGDEYYYLFTESQRADREDFKLNSTYFDYDGQTDDWEERGKELIDNNEPY